MRFTAFVRRGDLHDRRESEGAHAVYTEDGEGKTGRKLVGVWSMEHQADEVAAVLNKWAGRQIR